MRSGKERSNRENFHPRDETRRQNRLSRQNAKWRGIDFGEGYEEIGSSASRNNNGQALPIA
jgi:hypothetical protein